MLLVLTPTIPMTRDLFMDLLCHLGCGLLSSAVCSTQLWNFCDPPTEPCHCWGWVCLSTACPSGPFPVDGPQASISQRLHPPWASSLGSVGPCYCVRSFGAVCLQKIYQGLTDYYTEASWWVYSCTWTPLHDKVVMWELNDKQENQLTHTITFI